MTTLTFTQSIKADPNRVYRAFTSAMGLREWLCDGAQISAREGGGLYLSWNGGYFASGVFKLMEPGHRLVFTWDGRDEPAATEVEVCLEKNGSLTTVTINHTGIGTGDDWETSIGQFRTGWENGLENLKSLMETGVDQRQARRPILGLTSVSPLDAQQAEVLGVPVLAGLVVGGMVPDAGIAAAGLQVGDVIVGLAGQPVPDFSAYRPIMAAYQAGDTIEVSYYRGEQKTDVPVTLTSPPRPDVPATPGEVVEQLKAIHEELDSELDAIFENVTEAEAARKPAPGEWNACEVLAHLIWTERHTQFWMWGLVGGDDSIPWPDNNASHLNGILAAYPTVPDLIAAMKRAEVETIGIVAGLTPEFCAQKGTYHRLVTGALSLHYHNRDHFAQIQETIASVRQ